MILVYLFILAGIVISTLLLAKRIEERRKSDVFFLKLISKSDTRVRELHNEAVRLYSITKERTSFLVSRQIPRYSKSSLNKAFATIEESLAVYLDRLRDSKIIKKKDEGISEFFKSMSEVEKGGGEINDDIYIGETEPIREGAFESVESPRSIEVEIEVEKPITSPYVPEPMPQSTVEVVEPKAKKPRAPRKPSVKRKLKVVEVVGEE